jgi:hypothetical protein|tara:strand:+ start:839 stop:1252 length:414 start_codon:yes stop_codon:yes gene_type:complete
MNNVFDWLKQINSVKQPVSSFSDKDWEVFNSYMIHRFMSMNQEYIEVVNYVQEMPPQEKRMIYNIYREFIPRNNQWNKYIKSKIKQPSKELLDCLAKYWECSQNEAKDYITLLDTTQIRRILADQGLEKKEITKILK